jgi:hypothetical protein
VTLVRNSEDEKVQPDPEEDKGKTDNDRERLGGIGQELGSRKGVGKPDKGFRDSNGFEI